VRLRSQNSKKNNTFGSLTVCDKSRDNKTKVRRRIVKSQESASGRLNAAESVRVAVVCSQALYSCGGCLVLLPFAMYSNPTAKASAGQRAFEPFKHCVV
jgi:hypothetical protein